MNDPIKIFVGTEIKTKIPELVLGYSIRSNTSRTVEIVRMDDTWQMPKQKRWGTGFSLRRWMIPQYCHFKGRAIYLDADMLLVHDIGELWDMEISSPVGLCYQPDKFSPEKPVLQTSVMIIDCERARWEIPDIWRHLDTTYEGYHAFMKGSWWDFEPTRLPTEWNDFNHYDENTKLIHYTKESTQPWWRPEHRYSGIWREWLVKAIEAGVVTKEDLVFSFTKGVHASYLELLKMFDD